VKRWSLGFAAAALCIGIAACSKEHAASTPEAPPPGSDSPAHLVKADANITGPAQSPQAAAAVAGSLTRIHAHNLLLRKGPEFRVYILWLNGHLVPTKQDTTPSLDQPNSFVIEIQDGVIHARMADLSHYMNTRAAPATPLQKISISGDGDRISLHGTLHKLLVPLPVALEGSVFPSPDGRIRVHVDHLAVLKLPVKGVLANFKLTIADLMGNKVVPGIEAIGDDLFFDTQVLLPAPHIRGKLTKVRLKNPDIVVTYGTDAEDQAERTEQWHNFLSLKGGTLEFGKLTMQHVDLIMIDGSKEPWFDLDLVNYQAQLIYGYTRMTPQAGLQIFMPGLDKVPKPGIVGRNWLQDRDLPPPKVGLPATQ
jgi:hypothetical protein